MSQAGSFNTGSGPTPPPDPLTTLTLIDDFVSSISSENTIGDLSWNTQGVASSGGEINHPGIVTMPNNPGQSGYMVLSGSAGISNVGSFVLGGGEFSLNFVWKMQELSTGTDTFVSFVGLMDYASLTTFSTPINAIIFKYTHSVNSGNWQIVTTSASVSTTTNTSVAGDTNWHNFGIVVNTSGTSVTYSIDGVSVGTITTNIPTVNVAPSIFFQTSAGIPDGFSIDLFYSTLTLSNSRI